MKEGWSWHTADDPFERRGNSMRPAIAPGRMHFDRMSLENDELISALPRDVQAKIEAAFEHEWPLIQKVTLGKEELKKARDYALRDHPIASRVPSFLWLPKTRAAIEKLTEEMRSEIFEEKASHIRADTDELIIRIIEEHEKSEGEAAKAANIGLEEAKGGIDKSDLEKTGSEGGRDETVLYEQLKARLEPERGDRDQDRGGRAG